MRLIFSIKGTWGVWQDWHACSVTCGRGSQTRFRQCYWPDKNKKGAHCNNDGSEDTQNQRCDKNPCAGLQTAINNHLMK